MEIDRIEKLHSIGYGLKDAKVTINQDIKFNVAGLKINGTQGEVLNLPQWIYKKAWSEMRAAEALPGKPF